MPWCISIPDKSISFSLSLSPAPHVMGFSVIFLISWSGFVGARLFAGGEEQEEREGGRRRRRRQQARHLFCCLSFSYLRIICTQRTRLLLSSPSR